MGSGSSSKSQQATMWQERDRHTEGEGEGEVGREGETKQRGYHGHTHIYPFINGYVMRQGRKEAGVKRAQREREASVRK